MSRRSNWNREPREPHLKERWHEKQRARQWAKDNNASDVAKVDGLPEHIAKIIRGSGYKDEFISSVKARAIIQKHQQDEIEKVRALASVDVHQMEITEKDKEEKSDGGN